MEHKKERRSLAIAILISLFLHFAVGYALAAFGGAFAPTLPPDETPPELTLVDLSEPPPRVPKNPAYVETDPEKESAEKPKDQTFQSSANSIAASKVPPTGDLPLPSQDGKDRPDLSLDTHDFSLPTQGSQPQPQAQQPPAPESKPSPAASPKTKPSEPPKYSPEPSAAVSPGPEQLALLTSTPRPPLNAPEEVAPSPPEISSSPIPPAPRPKPESPASNYRAQKQETRIAGSISNRGRTAVNTVGTPLGRYQKQMYDGVGARWYQHMEQKRDLISIGTTRLTFTIDRSGHVMNLKVAENSANEAFASVCLQSVQELKMPPIPEDVASTLPPEGLTAELTFIMYAN